MTKLKNLTPATASYIREFIGECENPECPNNDNLNVHHIDGNRGNNNYRNIIVLCNKCHRKKAHMGPMSKSKQKEIVQNRSSKIKAGVHTILKKAVERQQGDISEEEFEKGIFDLEGLTREELSREVGSKKGKGSKSKEKDIDWF